jgi:hypothetical protein
MEKIPTLFLRDPQNMKQVTREVNPEAAWVLEGHGVATTKTDGTNIRVTVKDGVCTLIEKRRNPSREEKTAGAEPRYVEARRDDPADKHIIMAVDCTRFGDWPDGEWSCEALGPKIQGGVESSVPCLYPFSISPKCIYHSSGLRDFDAICRYLEQNAIEGIVWHDRANNRFAKIKRKDFGLSWPVRR